MTPVDLLANWHPLQMDVHEAHVRGFVLPSLPAHSAALDQMAPTGGKGGVIVSPETVDLAAVAAAEARKVSPSHEVAEKLTCISIGGGNYADLMPGIDSARVVYVLHNELAANAAQGDNAAAGVKSVTFRVLEKVHADLKIAMARSEGIVITELQPHADATVAVDSCLPQYDATCAASILHVLSYKTTEVVVFGSFNRIRWMQFISEAVENGLFQESQEEWCLGVRVVRVGREVDGKMHRLSVFFAPHPMFFQAIPLLYTAIGLAHEVSYDTIKTARRVSELLGVKLNQPVLVRGNVEVINVAIDAQHEDDKRFVIEGGVVTHNSHPWPKVFRNKAPANAIDLVSKWLRYEPKSRLDPFESLAHPFFDELREPGAKMPNQQPVPEKLFEFSENELKVMQIKGITKKLIPAHLMKNYKFPKV
jgi:hypothetical protein